MCKKLFSFCLTMVILLNSLTVVSAEEAEKIIVDIVNINEINYSQEDLALGKSKLIDAGMSTDLLSHLPDEVLLKASMSEEINTKSILLTESEVGEVIEGIQPFMLIPTNEDSLMAIEDKVEEIKSNIRIVDLPEIDTFGFQSSTVNSNSGKVYLELYSSIYGYDKYNTPYFQTIAYLRWIDMPSYRGQEFFGITRSNNIAYVPNSFGAESFYQEYYERVDANIWTGNIYTVRGPYNYERTNKHSNHDRNEVGFSINFALEKDIIPSSVSAGYGADIRVHYNYQAFIWYSGTLSASSPGTTYYVNHYLTLLHQSGTDWSISPSLSINYPWGASMYVTPSLSAKFNTHTLSILDAYSIPR